MSRKYALPAVLLAVLFAVATAAPAAAQEPTAPPGAMPAPAAAYGSLVTAMTQAHLQLEAIGATELENAQISLIDIADVVPAGDLQTYDSLVAQHNEDIVQLRSGLAANAELAERIAPFLTAAEIEEEPAAFFERVVAVEVDEEGNAIAFYYDGR